MSYRSVESFRAGPGWNCISILALLESCLQTCMTYTIARLQWINSWWWTEELSETCRVSWQDKFVKLVHLVGFIVQKFVTMHGHTNVKKEVAINLTEVRCGCVEWNHCRQNTLQQPALHDKVKRTFKVNKTRRLIWISAL